MAHKISENVLLKNYTTFKIGGPARYFFVAKSKEDLTEALNFVKGKKLKIFILGGGSNTLFSDNGFNGLVVKYQVASIKYQDGKIFAEAGVKLSDLLKFCVENNFAGLEWAAGIPKVTVGGAVFGNAQAFGTKISDFIEKVEAINLKTFKIKNFSKKDCKFSLKNSIFKKNKNLIIVSVIFNFKKSDEKIIQEKIKEVLVYRKNHHPMNFPSAGSIFINPENKNKIIPAGFLIEQCGLRGKKIGGAQFSEKHANFIINLGEAKAKDVVALIKLAQKKVKEKFKIKLETEIQII